VITIGFLPGTTIFAARFAAQQLCLRARFGIERDFLPWKSSKATPLCSVRTVMNGS